MTINNEICNAFNHSAASYEQSAIIQREVGERLVERLDYLAMRPATILDLGCGTGYVTHLLKKKYPKAHVVALDIAYEMLIEAKKKHALFRKWSLMAADMSSLPFKDGIFDLIIANQAIHWSFDLLSLFRSVSRILRLGGCFMFSTLGPDTFKELRIAFQEADHHQHTNIFPDMHDVGDLLIKTPFSDPVMDMEMLTLQYSSFEALLDSLKRQGVRNINKNRNQGLTGKGVWRQVKAYYEGLSTPTGKYPLTYEVVYGHAFKLAAQRSRDLSQTYIPVTSIGRFSKNKEGKHGE